MSQDLQTDSTERPARPLIAHSDAPSSHLQRRLGLIHATVLSMVNMVGVGPFITIPLIMSPMGGPQALLGWFAAVLIWARWTGRWPFVPTPVDEPAPSQELP